jgi:predicted nuclease of predicted toxin-antitoxin system
VPTFYADEDFPGPIVQRLRALGYDVLTAHEDGRANQKIPDPDVLARAIELGRVVLTKNRHDFHRLHAAVPDHFGIVTITDDKDRAALADRIHAAVSAHTDLAGVLIRVVKPNPPQVP